MFKTLKSPILPLLTRCATQGRVSQFDCSTMSTAELACSYAAMILHDDGIAITAEKIAFLVKSANVAVESYWPSLFAKLAEKRSLEDLILNAGSGGSSAPVTVAVTSGGAAAGVSAAAPAVEENKEEPKEESDGDMGFSLFD